MKENKRVKPKKEKKATSLRIYLLSAFGLFLIVSILTTWLFQIALLNQFYEQIQRTELRNIGKKMDVALCSEDPAGEIHDLAMKTATNIIVYRIDGIYASKTIHENGGNMNHLLFISEDRLSELYNNAKKNNGTFMSKVTFGAHEVKNGMRDTASLLYVKLCTNPDGTEYMMLLNSTLVPLDSTVNTLKQQFVWITAILILTSVAIAVPLSRKILKPIDEMNEAAKRLAKGNYEAEFVRHCGYRETQALAQSLDYAAQELSRTDQLQKELIANVSHDLRTPLTMIRAYSEVMRDIPGENTPENVQIIIDETSRLTTLVNDLLDVSRIQAGTHKPNMQLFDITTAVQEVLLRYEVFTKRQGYSIVFEGPDTAVPVFADRNMILQVIYNLINNAVNYTGEDLFVRVVETVTDERVHIAIQDTGEGIQPDQIPLIWDRYYKIDRIHRMARIGSGLGLSIVKGVLELHGAKYGVQSEVGKGSIFWFELPVYHKHNTND